MAEVHVIGELVGGDNFPSGSLFCKWGLAIGSAWKILEGQKEGQTQIDHPKEDTFSKWSHPIGRGGKTTLYIHLATKGLQGWPKIFLQVWHEDIFGRHELYAYGFCHIPTVPGMHEVECVTWKLSGSYKDQFTAFFMGGGTVLQDDSIIHSSKDRQKLHTEAMGTVYMKLGVILRNFEKFGIEVG